MRPRKNANSPRAEVSAPVSDDVPAIACAEGAEISGADEMSRRVAENLRRRRKARGMSLDDLARASGVSRAGLSQIETRKTNPTVGILWKIAVGLGLPFADLIGEPASTASVLRKSATQVLRSVDGKFMSRPLAPVAVHASDAHALGTREQLVVLEGALRVRVGDAVYELAEGDSLSFLADVAHGYENAGAGTLRVHNIIIYGR